MVDLLETGRSTLFNALASAAANRALTTADPKTSAFEAPDDRLRTLNAFVQRKRIIPRPRPQSTPIRGQDKQCERRYGYDKPVKAS